MSKEKIRAIQLYFVTMQVNGHPPSEMTKEMIDDILSMCCDRLKEFDEEY